METPHPQEVAGIRAPDRFESRWIRYVLLLVLALSAFLPFNFVYRFGVSVPYWDQWEFIPTLLNFHDGNLSLIELTKQHNEHRLFFPRLIMLGLAALTRYNNLAEMYFNAALLVALGAVLFHAHVRAFGGSNRSLLAFLPVPWFVFSFRQYENLIWGWQLQITLCVLCVVVSLKLLDGVRGLGARWAGAIAAAIVGTFSFGSGIMLWPVGALSLLWQGRQERRIPWSALVGWCVSAGIAGIMYTWHFHRPGQVPDSGSFLKAPSQSILFLFGVLGSVTSEQFPTAAAFGALLLVATGAVLFEVRRRRVDLGPLSLGLGLILFAGAVGCLVLVGRAGFGLEYSITSRYTTLTLLGFVGLHRVVLSLQDPSRRGLLMGVLVSAMGVAVFSSFTSGISAGYNYRNQFRQNRQVLQTIETRSDEEVGKLFVHTDWVRRDAEELRSRGLSVYPPKQ